MIDLVVSPEGPDRYGAYVQGRRLCVSGTPLLDSARILLSEGCATETPISMRHEGSQVISFETTVGHAASLVVFESKKGGMRFRKYQKDPRFSHEEA